MDSNYLREKTYFSGTIGACLSRAEEAYCASIVNCNSIKGVYGEAMMNSHILSSKSTIQVPLSAKPQGIDGIYILKRPKGEQTQLLVSEAKFGSSRLGQTLHGRQMSDPWIRKNLSDDAGLLSKSANSRDRIHAGFIKKHLKSSILKVEKRIYRISKDGTETLVSKGYRQVIKIKNSPASIRKSYGEVRREFYNQLNKKTHFSSSDRKEVRERYLRDKNGKIFKFKNQSFLKSMVFNSLRVGVYSGLTAATIDGVLQAAIRREVNLEQVANSFILGFSTGVASSITHHVLVGAAANSRFAYQVFSSVSRSLGMPSTMYTLRTVSGPIGAIVTIAGYEAIKLLTGHSDFQDSVKNVTIGSVSIGGSVLAASGIMATVGTFGTASTGVAISTLSGAAATNASLAVLGGGAISAGGGGMVVGTLVLSGGVLVVGVIAGFVATKTWSVLEESSVCKRTEMTASKLLDSPETLYKICSRYC